MKRACIKQLFTHTIPGHRFVAVQSDVKTIVHATLVTLFILVQLRRRCGRIEALCHLCTTPGNWSAKICVIRQVRGQ